MAITLQIKRAGSATGSTTSLLAPSQYPMVNSAMISYSLVTVLTVKVLGGKSFNDKIDQMEH